MTILEYKESECVQKEDKAAARQAVQRKERVKKKNGRSERWDYVWGAMRPDHYWEVYVH